MWGSAKGKVVSGARKVYARFYFHLQTVRPLSQPQCSGLWSRDTRHRILWSVKYTSHHAWAPLSFELLLSSFQPGLGFGVEGSRRLGRKERNLSILVIKSLPHTRLCWALFNESDTLKLQDPWNTERYENEGKHVSGRILFAFCQLRLLQAVNARELLPWTRTSGFLTHRGSQAGQRWAGEQRRAQDCLEPQLSVTHTRSCPETRSARGDRPYCTEGFTV